MVIGPVHWVSVPIKPMSLDGGGLWRTRPRLYQAKWRVHGAVVETRVSGRSQGRCGSFKIH